MHTISEILFHTGTVLKHFNFSKPFIASNINMIPKVKLKQKGKKVIVVFLIVISLKLYINLGRTDYLNI